VNSIVFIVVVAEMVTDVGAPLLVNVAVLSGHGRVRTPVRSRGPLASGAYPGAVGRVCGFRRKRRERTKTGAGNKE
jgi:hypothetical protein